MVTGAFPRYPRHLTGDEQALRAMLLQSARDLAEATVQEKGIARDAVDMDALIAEATVHVTLAWLQERVGIVEAELAKLTEPRKAKGNR